MIKAFISHSSVQKAFVQDLVDVLGRNYCIVDCYNFEPAYKTLDEIYRKIDSSTVFVLLLSRESLQSEWVETEIRYARLKLQSRDYNRFWPYIIDGDLELKDCPEWMVKEECFNLQKFKSHVLLAHDIQQKFRNIIWSENPKKKQIESLLVGRNLDVEVFEDIYQSERGMSLKALIVSGRNGVGKDMFISKCLDKMGFPKASVPCSINLGNKEGIENFIIQLNLITGTYDNDKIIEVLKKDTSGKIKIATLLINQLLDKDITLSVNDEMACILPNRQLADWLVDIFEKSNINNKFGIFIKSRVMPNSFIETDHPSFGHVNLKPLDTKDRMKLFYSLMRIYNLTGISEADVKWFVNKLLLSPSQLVKVIEALSKFELAKVKNDIGNLISWGDEQIKPVILHFFNDELSKQVLIVLSRLDIVSYGILDKFFDEEIVEATRKIDEMIDYGIVSAFGPNDHFFRLDHYLSDYIKRCNILLEPDLECHLNEILEDMIASSSDITEDVSVYLYDKKKRIVSGKGMPDDFLIPSVVVTSVMEIYNKQDYGQVIKLCDIVLNDVHNYFQDQERELRYWLCLALSRTTNNRFYNEVKYFKNDIEYYFLRGFYHRNAGEYEQAEKFFEEALKNFPNMQRAKREMVTVLLAQEKYEKALELAKENYEQCPDNTYQIHGYFRCLVRKYPLNVEDITVLKNLMRAMNDNLSDKREEMYAAMNIEFSCFALRWNYNQLSSIIEEARRRFPDSANINRAIQSVFIRYKISSKKDV